jgi:hypothetical protein
MVPASASHVLKTGDVYAEILVSGDPGCDAFPITEFPESAKLHPPGDLPPSFLPSRYAPVTERAAIDRLPAAAARIREAFAPLPFNDAGALVPSARAERD